MNRGSIIILLICLVCFFGCTKKATYYYPTGEVQFVVEYVGDEIKGKGVYYYKNGNIKKETNFKAGIEHGNAKYYYESGEVEYTVPFVNGKEHGVYISYYKNGQVMVKALFVDGIQKGELLEYYEDGQLKHKANYKGYKIIEGKAIYYHENGEVSMISEHKNDSLIYYDKYDETGKNITSYRNIRSVPEKSIVSFGEQVNIIISYSGPVPSKEDYTVDLVIYEYNALNEAGEVAYRMHGVPSLALAVDLATEHTVPLRLQKRITAAEILMETNETIYQYTPTQTGKHKLMGILYFLPNCNIKFYQTST
jgi:antitoxin component YwqK of YwqJK toxin-antitoxin module